MSSRPRRRRFTLTVRELHSLLRTANEFTSADDMLPVLTCVKLVGAGREVRAVATARFAAAVVRHELADDKTVPAFEALLKRTQIKAVLSAFVPGRRETASRPVQVTVSPGLHVEFYGTTVDGTDLTMRLAPLDAAAFPDVEKIVAGACDPDRDTGRGTIGVNPDLLARLKAVPRGWGEPVELLMPSSDTDADTNSRAIGVRVGDHFTAAIMPKRRLS